MDTQILLSPPHHLPRRLCFVSIGADHLAVNLRPLLSASSSSPSSPSHEIEQADQPHAAMPPSMSPLHRFSRPPAPHGEPSPLLRREVTVAPPASGRRRETVRGPSDLDPAAACGPCWCMAAGRWPPPGRCLLPLARGAKLAGPARIC
jgi:hypothetical protein